MRFPLAIINHSHFYTNVTLYQNLRNDGKNYYGFHCTMHNIILTLR
jgi:hypothetical protein